MTTASNSGTLSLEKGKDTCPLWQGKDAWLPFSHGGIRLEIQITCIRGTQTRPGVPDSDRWSPVSVSHYPRERMGPGRSAGVQKVLGKEVQTKKMALGKS